MKKITLLILAILATNLSQGQFLENFNGATFPPANWAVYRGANGLGTGFDWVRSGTAPNFYAFNRWEAVSGGVAEDWLVTPLIAVNATQNELRFDATDFNGPEYGSQLSIRVSTTSQTDRASFVEIENLNESELGNNTAAVFSPFIVNLSAYLNQSVYIAFVHIQNDGDAVAVDNVEVVAGAACNTPQALDFTAFSNTTATIAWTNSGDFEIEYGVFPYTQGNITGTLVNVTAATSYQLTGLTPGVSYNVFVRQNCGVDGFSAVETLIVGTAPNIVNTFPYSNNLEPASNQALVLNLGLSFFTNTNDWAFGQDNLTDGNTANDFAFDGVSYVFSNNTFTDAAADATIYFGPFALNAGSSYTFGFQQRNTALAGATRPNKDFEILAASTNDGTTNTVLATFDDTNNITHQPRSGTFVPTASGNYFFGVRDKSSLLTGVTQGNSVVVDAVSVTSTLGIADFDPASVTHFFNKQTNTLNINAAQNVMDSVAIYNLVGQQVIFQKVNQSTATIAMDGLADGVYVANVIVEGTSVSIKFVK